MERSRIPYEVWRNSQLSLARFGGKIMVNGKRYVLDTKNAKVTKPLVFGQKPEWECDLVEKFLWEK